MIHTYKTYAGTLELSKIDLELFSLIKLRQDNQCRMCQKQIKKGCYVLGKGYYKFCIECSPKLLDNSISSMNGFIVIFKNLKNILSKNKQEYMRNNVANSL